MYLLNPMNSNSRNKPKYLPCKYCGFPVKIAPKYAWMIKDKRFEKATAACCTPENPRVLGMRIQTIEEKDKDTL